MTGIEKNEGRGLHTLAQEINSYHRQCEEAAGMAVASAIKAGEKLIEVKAECPHGEWTGWIEANFEGSSRTARMYMQLYRERDKLQNGSSVADLSLRGALKALSAADEVDPFDEVVGFIESEARRLAEVELPGRPENPSEGLKELIEHEKKMVSAIHQVGDGLLLTLESVREIRERYDYGRAAGWLREALISLSVEGPYGHVYKEALVDAREGLYETVADEALKVRITRRIYESYGPVTVDLVEEETTLLQALAPELLDSVNEAWKEDQAYELAMRKMETFTRPVDVPPSREHGGYKDRLTEEQMHTAFAELRKDGVFIRGMRD